MNVKTGDTVRFLNSTGGGKVVKIDGGIAHVEDADGFLTPVLVKEIVVVGNADTDQKKVVTASGNIESAVNNTPTPLPALTVEEEPLEEYVETPEAEKLNLMLAFIPTDSKKPAQGPWEAYIVNDSNFWLFLNFMSKDSTAGEWTLRASKTIEPGTQLFLEEIDAETLNDYAAIRVQYVAYKNQKPFAAKRPGDIEEQLELTNFYKQHCYQPNLYFEEEVISIMLVSNDKPLAHEAPTVEPEHLRRALLQKQSIDLEPKRPTFKHKTPKARNPLEPLVVDLHIEELVDNTKGMSAADMLNRQIDEFRAIMDEHKNQKGKKIIFIHGKGEGVLRKALLKELNHLYKGNDVQDASFKEYGFGATQVTIR